ncbi:MAG: hypothetical protein AVO35_07960 [Candidatus Aegiribacteria sp. MLS_C]|nr:MAG: hypothetical protein AVO35_07960 [Candidatus Aegiribacteria sp. MLS_C]
MGKLVLMALLIALTANAGDFETGGSEMFRFSGYNQFRFAMWGEEGHDPSNGFDFYNRTTWSPEVGDILSARLSFDTRYGFVAWDSLSGYVSDDFTLKLVEAYGTLELSPEILLSGGRFKLPFGYGYTRSGASIPHYDRVYAVSRPDFGVYGGLDVGIMLSTDFGPVIVDLAYTNGTDSAADTTVSKQFTARLSLSPADWLSAGGAVAIIGQPEVDTMEEWSATGLDFYLHGDYAITSDLMLNYEGEYMILPWPGPVLDNMENESGGDYSLSLAGTREVDMGLLTGIQPAIRFEMISPPEQVSSGDPVPETDVSVLDYCLNLHTGPLNTVQLGGRSFSFENGGEGHTDVYVNWRMLF